MTRGRLPPGLWGGRVLVSVAVRKDRIRLYERLVQVTGDVLIGDYSAAGFDIGYVLRPEGIHDGQSWTAVRPDPALPIARLWEDNKRSRGYGLLARLMGNQWCGVDGTGLPDDLPDVNAGPWEPDPHWQRFLWIGS